uniref:Uncharacterized protein n=1 Tax=Rhabditophanes sp. KR3021 TaxID=114890 RepID=A0AC35UFI6_9BILA
MASSQKHLHNDRFTKNISKNNFNHNNSYKDREIGIKQLAKSTNKIRIMDQYNNTKKENIHPAAQTHGTTIKTDITKSTNRRKSEKLIYSIIHNFS